MKTAVNYSGLLLAAAIATGCTPHHHHPHNNPLRQHAAYTMPTQPEKSAPTTKTSGHHVTDITTANRRQPVTKSPNTANTAARQPAPTHGRIAVQQPGEPMAAHQAMPDESNHDEHDHDHAFTGKFWEKVMLRGLDLFVNITSLRRQY